MIVTNEIELLGSIAAILTTSAFLPQVYKTWKTKDVEGLSLAMYMVFFAGVILWLGYGILIDSLPVIIANAFTGVSGAFIIYCKLKYWKSAL